MTQRKSFHESYESHVAVKLPSNRKFGLVMTGFFALVGLAPLRSHHPMRIWALVISGAFLLVLLAAPNVLLPLNRLWMKLGTLMGHVVGTVAMGVMFYLIFTPVGLVMRMMGKDPLRLKWKDSETSYWIKREPPGPAPESMRLQS